jgi:phage terminase large subunit-like protein
MRTAWLIRGEDHYLLDLVRARFDFLELKRRAFALHQRWKPIASLVEDKGTEEGGMARMVERSGDVT